MNLPSPHGDKLTALLQNSKLPSGDLAGVQLAIERYTQWLAGLRASDGNRDQIITEMVSLLNSYKFHVDMELIFDSNDDFLYRQKGQLKLDNSIVEEFIPHLVTNVLADDLKDLDLSFGPTNTFSSLHFEEDMKTAHLGAGMRIGSKDPDFAISRKLFIRTSHQQNFQESATSTTNIAYVAAEIKTNLDKTMFQEAAATALNIKSVVPGARYYLLCEWLDMLPISTATTAIDEILILRRAKRISSKVRSAFATASGRKLGRESYVEYLTAHPVAFEPFSRFVDHIGKLLANHTEDDVVGRGYF